MTVAGDGQCLFTSFRQATSALKIGLDPSTSSQQLRSHVIHFLRLNKDNNVLYAPCMPMYAPHNLDSVSPTGVIRTQMAYVMVDGQRCTSPTQKNSRVHTCNGSRYGEIMMGANSSQTDPHLRKYQGIEDYLEIMVRPQAYAEDLEIMALSVIYRVTIAIFTPRRREKPTLQCFFHPRAIATIVLYNADGQGHYEWLNFKKDESFTLVTRRSRMNTMSAPSKDSIPPGTPFQPLLINSIPFPPSNPVERFWVKQILFPCEMIFGSIDALTSCSCDQEDVDGLLQYNCNCEWQPLGDPWNSVETSPPIPFYAEATDALLHSLSLAFIRVVDKGTSNICCNFFLRRIAIMLNTFYLAELINVDEKCEQELSLTRDIMIQIHDAVDMIVKHATTFDLPTEQIEQIHNLATGLANGLNASRDLVEKAFAALALSIMDHSAELVDDATEVIHIASESPAPASQSSVVSASDIDRVDAHLAECQNLHEKANKALEMALFKLKLVSAENKIIYALQIDQLALNLEQSITEIRRRIAIISADKRSSKAATHRLPLMIRCLECIEKVDSDLRTLAAKVRALQIKPAPSPSASTPRKKQKPTTPKINLQLEAQITAIDSVIRSATEAATRATRSLRCSQSLPEDGKACLLQRTPAEQEEELSDEGLLDEEEQAIALRKEAQSSTSHIMGEAVKADGLDVHGDSLDSAVNDHSPTAEDLAFISNSQQKDKSSRHPSFAAAKEAIEKAAVDEIVSLSKIKSHWFKAINAYCKRGHRLELEPKLRLESTTAQCFFCREMLRSKLLVTCTCSKASSGETFFACHDCLKGGNSFPPPPECPSLSCTGQCLVKHIPISKTCAACNLTIPPNCKAWFCSAEKCKHILCIPCRNSSLPSDARCLTSPPKPPAYSSLKKTASGLPAPLPGIGHARRK